MHEAPSSSRFLFGFLVAGMVPLLLIIGCNIAARHILSTEPESRQITQQEADRRFGWVPKDSRNHYVYRRVSPMNGDGVELLYFELSPQEALALRDELSREFARWEMGPLPDWVAQNYQRLLESYQLPTNVRLPGADQPTDGLYHDVRSPFQEGDDYVPSFEVIDTRNGRVWYWHWSQ